MIFTIHVDNNINLNSLFKFQCKFLQGRILGS